MQSNICLARADWVGLFVVHACVQHMALLLRNQDREAGLADVTIMIFYWWLIDGTPMMHYIIGNTEQFNSKLGK